MLALAPIALLAAAAVCDMRWRIIPNGLTAALAAGGAAWAGASLGWPGAAWTALAAAAVFAGGAALFALGAMGGGDVKLAAALCLWLAPAQVGPFLLATALAGGALALGLLVWRFGAALHGGQRPRAAWGAALRAPAPYGVAIAMGGAAVLAGGG